MATGDPSKECGVCCEDYDQDIRCPRILKCYHTLCTDCISRSIRSNNQRCPFCRRPFRVNTAHEVTVNQAALDLVKFISIQESNSKSDENRCYACKSCSPDPVVEMNETCGELLMQCTASQKQVANILKYIEELHGDIKQEKSFTENSTLLHSEKISRIERSETRLQKADYCLRIQLKEVESKINELQVMKARLGDFLANKQMKSSSMKEEAEGMVSDVQKWLLNFKKQLAEGGEIRSTIKEIEERDAVDVAADTCELNGKDGVKDSLLMNTAALSLQGDFCKQSLGIGDTTDNKEIIVLEVLNQNRDDSNFEDPNLASKFIAALTFQKEVDGHKDMEETPIFEESRLKRLLDQSRLFATQTFRGKRFNDDVIKDYSNLCLHQELFDFTK
ncbi:E3 ubiquitin-protein ligase TRIM32-like isoform X2 [Macrobrachium nipponense]|uniref:E3 ubiquitin-protein ligase TRIM32-like isoform X2 n=1 Tax=Macrobrachium nipponense TaxID=159736 RepID=UPI0030C7F128